MRTERWPDLFGATSQATTRANTNVVIRRIVCSKVGKPSKVRGTRKEDVRRRRGRGSEIEPRHQQWLAHPKRKCVMNGWRRGNLLCAHPEEGQDASGTMPGERQVTPTKRWCAHMRLGHAMSSIDSHPKVEINLFFKTPIKHIGSTKTRRVLKPFYCYQNQLLVTPRTVCAALKQHLRPSKMAEDCV